ncbi:MAG: hypothetical protein VW882_05975 [Gammaproteobacteria bacterium]|jgi:hypothetical protein
MKKYLLYVSISLVSLLVGIFLGAWRLDAVHVDEWLGEHAASADALIKIRESFHKDEGRALTILDVRIKSTIDTLEFIDRTHGGLELENFGETKTIKEITDELRDKYAKAKNQVK